MAIGEDGYVVLGSRDANTQPWDGSMRPKVEQGFYVLEVAGVEQGIGTGPKVNGSLELKYSFRVVSGWDVDAEKPIDTPEVGKDVEQRYWDHPNTISRYENLLQAIHNVPDEENGHYPGASVGKRFIGEVVHSNKDVDDPTSSTGRKTLTFCNVQGEQPMPEPAKPAAQASGGKGAKPATPPPPQNARGNAGKTGGASARR